MVSEATQAGLFCILFFFVGFNSGYPSTFFPVFAQNHGIDLSSVGIFISMYSVGGCLTSFASGWIVDCLGSRVSLGIGIFFAFATNIILALMYFFADSSLFLPICVSCRFLIGMGASCIYVIGYTFSLSTTNATTYVVAFETLYGVGIAFGPVFSANVFNIWGYVAAFGILGSFGVILLPILGVLDFKHTEGQCHSDVEVHGDKSKQHVSMYDILKNGGVCFVSWLILVAWACMFWIQPIWQPYMKLLDAGSVRVQLSFALLSIGYLVGGPSLLVAFKYLKIHQVMGLGMFLCGASMGPLFVDSVWLESICSFCLGFGIAFFSMPSLQMIDLILPAYYDAHVAISALFSLFSYIGGFLGPTAAAIIYNSVDPAFAFISISMVTLVTLAAWMFLTPSYRPMAKDDGKLGEKTPLLAPLSPFLMPGGDDDMPFAPSPAFARAASHRKSVQYENMTHLAV